MVQGSRPHGVRTSCCESSTQGWVHRDSVRLAPRASSRASRRANFFPALRDFSPLCSPSSDGYPGANDARGPFRLSERHEQRHGACPYDVILLLYCGR